jgi:DNA polymerase IIIc chi subunit
MQKGHILHLVHSLESTVALREKFSSSFLSFMQKMGLLPCMLREAAEKKAAQKKKKKYKEEGFSISQQQ